MKLPNVKTPHGPNAMARFSEGFSTTVISPRAIGTPLALSRICRVRSLRCEPSSLTLRYQLTLLALTYSPGTLFWCQRAFLRMGSSQYPRQDLWKKYKIIIILIKRQHCWLLVG